MATINPVVNRTIQGANSIVTATWGPMAAGDVCIPVSLTDWADRSVQFTGTFGGSVAIQGSNEATPVNYATLNDPSNNPLSISTPAIKQCLEMALWLRPNPGIGVAAVTVTMAGRQLIPLAWS